jgi:DNA-binding response OmpR family regulator
MGVDDYVTKPFALRELLARIKAVLRRLAPATESTAAPSALRERLCFDGWDLDVAARQLLDRTGQSVLLTGGEFDLLCVLAQHPGRVLSRDFLLEHTRGRDAAPFDRTIDVQIGRLRRKLGDDADDPRIIKSVRGVGYVLTPRVDVR